MNLRIVAAVFRAEFASVVRDRRTILTSVLVPVILYPVLGLALTTFASTGLVKIRDEKSKVCVLGTEADVAAIAGVFEGSGARRLDRVECAEGAAPGGAIDAIADVPAGTAETLASGGGVEIPLRYSSADFRGARAQGRFEDALDRLGERLVTGRIAAHALPERFASPFKHKSTDVAPPARSNVFVWAPAIVVFLMLFSLLGVFLPAIDLTAGDRERLTLETLLTAPVSATELIAGKFGVVLGMGMITTVLNIASLWATLSSVTAAAPGLEITAAISTRVALLLLAATLPVVALSASLCMALGCLARSFRDAQNYMTPVYLGLLVPAYASALPDAKLTAWRAAVPMLNTSLMLRDILSGTLVVRYALIATVVDIAFGAAALVIAGKLYGHEGIAFADAQPLDLLKRPAGNSSRFTPTEGITLFILSAALLFYAGIPLQAHIGLYGVIATELLILLPPLVWTFWRRVDLTTAFALRPPSLRGAAAALLLGAGMWVPATLWMNLIQEPIFPMPPGTQEALKSILGVGAIPWPALLAVGALMPAVCEEMLLRGAVMQALLPTQKRRAILIAAVLFALMHMDPWRLAPTFALGLVAGTLVYATGSIAAGMLFHFTNNGLLLAFGVIWPGENEMSWWVLPAGAACAIAGASLLLGPSLVARPARETQP